jgi:hypothetical protein
MAMKIIHSRATASPRRCFAVDGRGPQGRNCRGRESLMERVCGHDAKAYGDTPPTMLCIAHEAGASLHVVTLAHGRWTGSLCSPRSHVVYESCEGTVASGRIPDLRVRIVATARKTMRHLPSMRALLEPPSPYGRRFEPATYWSSDA